MTIITSALVIGGGIAGMSAAIALREAGIAVHLIDRDADWKVYGAGITITGPTLRVLKRLGVLDEVLARGHAANGIQVYNFDGAHIALMDTGLDIEAGVPGAGGIMRPVLHNILSRRLLGLDPEVSLGVWPTQLPAVPGGEVLLSDGQSRHYDLIVGADGIFSDTRRWLFPDAPAPKYVGQICWRLMARRHPAIERRTYFLGGPSKVGMTPVSDQAMYMFLLEAQTEFDRDEFYEDPVRLRRLMEPFGGAVGDLVPEIDDTSQIVARPLETVFLATSWYRENVVLVGDAAHATTPQLASGAGMAMEDGVVLADSIMEAADLDSALARFQSRRLPRCSLVVENSLMLGQIEKRGSSPMEHMQVFQQALAQLNKPY